jgi:hypothetical protein
MTILQDVDIFLGGALLPKQLKYQLPQVHRAFTLNMEAVNGVTYRPEISQPVTPIDLIDVGVVS